MSHFIDPVTGENLGCPSADNWDVHGTDLAGEDEDGFWWGTERAAWRLSDADVVVVNGFVLGMPWRGRVLGTEAEALTFAKQSGVRDAEVE